MASDLKHGTLAGGGTVSVAGSVEVSNDAGNPLPVSGTVEVANDVGNPIPVSGTLAVTESGTWTVVLDATSLAALETIQAAQSGAWEVSLSAASLAALESITATVSNLPTETIDDAPGTGVAVTLHTLDSGDSWQRVRSGELGDGRAGESNPGVIVYLYNGSTHDRLRGDTANGLDVDVTRLPAVALDAASLAALETTELGAATLAALESITVVDGGGTLSIDDGGGSITVDGTVTVSGVASTEYTEDAASAANPSGGQLMGRRRDTLTAAEVSADSDVIALNATAKGELYVKQTDAVPVTDNGGSLSVDDGGGSLTVDGTVEIGATSLAALESITVVDGGGAVSVDDNGGSLTVDGTFWQATQPVSGPLTDAQLRASAVPVSGSLSVALVQDDAGTTVTLEAQEVDGHKVLFVADPALRRLNEQQLMELRILNANVAALVEVLGGRAVAPQSAEPGFLL